MSETFGVWQRRGAIPWAIAAAVVGCGPRIETGRDSDNKNSTLDDTVSDAEETCGGIGVACIIAGCDMEDPNCGYSTVPGTAARSVLVPFLNLLVANDGSVVTNVGASASDWGPESTGTVNVSDHLYDPIASFAFYAPGDPTVGGDGPWVIDAWINSFNDCAHPDTKCFSPGNMWEVSSGLFEAGNDAGLIQFDRSGVLGWERVCVLADGAISTNWHDGAPLCGEWEECPAGSVADCVGGGLVEVDGVRYRSCDAGFILRDRGGGWELYAGTPGLEGSPEEGVLASESLFGRGVWGNDEHMRLAVAAGPRLLLLDLVNQRIYAIDLDSDIVTTLSGNGPVKHSLDTPMPDGEPSDYEFAMMGMAECPGGTMLIAALDYCVVAFHPDGTVTHALGDCGAADTTEPPHHGGPADEGFVRISDVRCDSGGRGLALADYYLWAFQVE